jgi:chromosome segregation ATPase
MTIRPLKTSELPHIRLSDMVHKLRRERNLLRGKVETLEANHSVSQTQLILRQDKIVELEKTIQSLERKIARLEKK